MELAFPPASSIKKPAYLPEEDMPVAYCLKPSEWPDGIAADRGT